MQFRVLVSAALVALALTSVSARAAEKEPDGDSDDKVAAVPGPTEGIGLPFMIAGGAAAVAFGMSKRRKVEH